MSLSIQSFTTGIIVSAAVCEAGRIRCQNVRGTTNWSEQSISFPERQVCLILIQVNILILRSGV